MGRIMVRPVSLLYRRFIAVLVVKRNRERIEKLFLFTLC
jgi:hypothetical protein